MLPEAPGPSLPSLFALAAEQLALHGYRVVRDVADNSFPGEAALLAEDEYSILAVVAFETWSDLDAEWPEAQAALVDLITRRLARAAPKSWDGYLFLLCATPAPDFAAVAVIERDTSRLRKIVATADRLKTTGDLTRYLEIFFPLSPSSDAKAQTDILESLPDVLESSVPPGAVRAVIEAFREMEPPLERLHEWKHSA